MTGSCYFVFFQVWDMDTLQCTMTLNEHTDIVTSLICWDQYLLSCSSDCTIKVWACTEVGSLKVVYTHTEENVCYSTFYCLVLFLFVKNEADISYNGQKELVDLQ